MRSFDSGRRARGLPHAQWAPQVAPSIESAIDGYVAVAEIFIPRAKRLAEATDKRWPEEFEQASVSYFEKSVGVQLAL